MANTIDLAATSIRSYGKNSYETKPFEHIYTCNTGELVPAFATVMINPGSTYKITTSILARLNTSRYPTIARGWIEYAWFYVPHMQIWDHWNNLIGVNTDAAWIASATYSVPKIQIGANDTIQYGSVLDHLGWSPAITGGFEGSALKLRAYNQICNYWFRDENIEAPFAPATGDSAITYSTSGDWTVGNTLYKVNRKADYFSTCTPQIIRAPAGSTLIPLGTSAPLTTTSAPVIGDGYNIGIESINALGNKETFGLTGGLTVNNVSTYLGGGQANKTIGTVTSSLAATKGNSAIGLSQDPTKSHIYADLSNTNVDLSTSNAAANLYKVREAAVTTHIFERDTRSGNHRVDEILWARWGVEVDDIEIGIPRLLNTNRFPIEFEQVPQTSSSDATSPQGTLTAFGYTNNRSDQETFSFKYHGTLMCLVWIRFEHKYQSGMASEDQKFDRFDFWHPEMAGLGDQAVYDFEIYATGGNAGTIKTRSVFGYQERASEYKNFPSLITGQTRSSYSQTMDYVHMADEYASLPVLSAAWMKENPDNLDRTIFVTSSTANQWLVDFVAEFEITDTIPLYSIPGIDRL